MSSGQRPRRREYFPRMKVRGKGRRYKNTWRYWVRGLGVSFVSLAQVLGGLGRAAEWAAAAMAVNRSLSVLGREAAAEREYVEGVAARALASWKHEPIGGPGFIVDPSDSERAIAPSGRMAASLYLGLPEIALPAVTAPGLDAWAHVGFIEPPESGMHV